MPKQFDIALGQATNRKGKVIIQVDEAIQLATLEARETGKATSVTVKLSFNPMPNKPHVMGIGGEVTVKLPGKSGKAYDNLIFSDQKGELHLNSPQADAFVNDDIPDNLLKIRNA